MKHFFVCLLTLFALHNAKAQGIQPSEVPTTFDGWYKEGMLRARTKDFKGAVVAFTECLKLKPQILKLYQLRAEAALEAGDTTAAQADYTKMTELVPTSDTMRIVRAGFYLRTKKYEQAIADYTFVINRNKSFDGCWLNRGGCYMKLNQFNKAIDDFNYLINKNPVDVKAIKARAEAYCKKGDLEKAWSDEYKVYDLGDYMNLPCSKWLTQKGVGSNLYKFSKRNEKVLGGSLYGFVNSSDKVVVPAIYDNAHDFSEGMALVCKVINGKLVYGYVDATGKEVIPCKYGAANNFSEGLAMVADSNTYNAKFGFINYKGVEVIAKQYQVKNEITGYNSNGFFEGIAIVEKNYKCGGINKKGEVVIPFVYSSIKNFREGLSSVSEGGEINLINHKGEKTRISNSYHYCAGFSEGLAVVSTGYSNIRGLDSKDGVIDRKGQTIVMPTYEIIYNYQEGLAAAEKMVAANKRRYGFIDKTGKAILPFIYKNVSSFSEGLAKVTTEDGKSMFIDKTGKEVIKLENAYEYAQIEFRNGCVVIDRFDKSSLLIDKAGKAIAEIK